MPEFIGKAVSHPNIALIKYWGNVDERQNIPSNSSISINLEELETVTEVSFSSDNQSDTLQINGRVTGGISLERVSGFLNHIRSLTHISQYAKVVSNNNFPIGSGIASSAAAFAALALAATKALGLDLNQKDLSRLARLGSGSACRSIPDGFVYWNAGISDEDSYAYSIASPNYWNLVDCIAVFSTNMKKVLSSEGHRLANSSPIQQARIIDAPRRLELCKSAIELMDFDKLAAVVELDSNLLHAIAMTSSPPIFYWEPDSLNLMKQIQAWRNQGIPVCFTVDAGPNVHVLTISSYMNKIKEEVENIPGTRMVLTTNVGCGTRQLPLNAE